MVADGVVDEPNNFEGQICEVADIGKVLNWIFAQVQFCQFAALLECVERVDFVKRQTTNFQGGEILYQSHVFKFAAPHVKVFNLGKLIALAASQNELLGQFFHFQIANSNL